MPFKGLLAAVGAEVPFARATDPFFAVVQGQGASQLTPRWEALRCEEIEGLRKLREAVPASTGRGGTPCPPDPSQQQRGIISDSR